MDDTTPRHLVHSCEADAGAGSSEPLHVVGIGAGAGGLESIQLLFGALSTGRSLAFVICRHVQPGLSDPLADLLRTLTAMPVIPAEHGTKLEAGRIHLVTPEAKLIVLKDRLASFSVLGEVYGDEQETDAVSPIDLLLHSMAASLGAAAIAIILSGHDDDGLNGARSIRDHGGLVLAQHPETAEFADMPRCVIDAKLASAFAPPGALPDLIERYLGKAKASERGSDDVGKDDHALMRIAALLEARLSIDAHAYRPSLLARCARRRLSQSAKADLSAYAEHLASDEGELSALHDDLLIRVTAFFRDPDAFGALRRDVVPDLVERMTKTTPIRIWVPACASGEEAYSLAMLLLDRIEHVRKEPHLEILASDRHVAALKRARVGRYRLDRLGNVPPDLVERYMREKDGRIEVGARLRRHVTFVDHDLLQAPPPDDIDLVSCRNLLIYLTKASREKALEACTEALKSDGYLFLGSSEQPGPAMADLATIDGKWRIYRKMAPPPVEDALATLAAVKKRAPAETILPPDQDDGRPPNSPPSEDVLSAELDGVMAENQRMLESTIDTLLASNDTLRKRNRDLRAENQRLTNAHAALDDIATMIAHDLRAPLRTIDQLAARLKEAIIAKGEERDEVRWLQPIQHQLIGLDRLIDDLLTYARQGPADGADLQSVDVGDLLRETLTLIGLPKGVKVLMRPPSLKVKTWRIPLACILRNLLGQAIERIGVAPGSIRIEAAPKDHLLEITITDDGQQPRDDGSGLGLAIVRQLLEGAGGRLTSSADPEGEAHQVGFTWPIQGQISPLAGAEPSRSA